MGDELRAIIGDEFQTQYGLITSTGALCRALKRSNAVTAVRQALRRAQLDDSDLRKLVQSLLRIWKPGELFPHDVAFAAIAVVLEDRTTEFADEYLFDLARLDSKELPKSTRIARQCLANRSLLSHSTSRQFLVAPAQIPALRWTLVPGDRELEVCEISRECSFSEAVCPN